MRISDWSSDVCSSDLCRQRGRKAEMETGDLDTGGVRTCRVAGRRTFIETEHGFLDAGQRHPFIARQQILLAARRARIDIIRSPQEGRVRHARIGRSEEHTSELQSLMRSSYADFCLKKKN